jgi:prepilin-type N-terminal cleavage/methylation domain-containing protein
MRRYAFTMIELIFAIVVISIAIVSLPVMTQRTDKTIEANIVQEAIFAAGTVITEGFAFYWDTSSQYDQNVSAGYSRVIDTSGTSCSNASGTNRRPGHINRQCLISSAITPLDDNTSYVGLDYLETLNNGTSIILNNTSTTAYATYKSDYNATARVTRCVNVGDCTPFNPSQTTDIDLKEISYDISDDSGVIIKLRAYSSNIGEIEPAHRILP